MAITRVQTATAGVGSSPTVTTLAPVFASSVTAGNVLVVIVRDGVGSGGGAVESVTDSLGTEYHITTGTATSAPVLYIYKGVAPRSGANTVTVTYGLDAATRWVFAIEYAGVPSTPIADVAATLAGGGPTDLVSAPFSTTAPSVVIAAATQNGVATYTAGTDFTLLDGTLGGGGADLGGVEDYITSGPLTNYTAHMTSDSGGVAYALAVIAISSTTAPAVPAYPYTQVYSRLWFNVNFAQPTGYLGFLAGSGEFVLEPGRVVAAAAGVFRHLTIRVAPGLSHPTIMVTLYVNNVGTALSVVLPEDEEVASNTNSYVEVAAGDDVTLFLTGVGVFLGQAYPLGASLRFDGDCQMWGLTQVFGDPGDGTYGGALGNGFGSEWPGVPALSNSYSICAVPGALTRLRLKSFDGDLETGTWTALIQKNTVPQDGSGGTVDTRCVLTGANSAASATFHLPLVVGDRVDLRMVYTGDPNFGQPTCAGVGFVPTDEDAYMFCGGSNNASLQWQWVLSEQGSPENENTVPIGFDGVLMRGFYAELTTAPGNGATIHFTLLKNGAATALTPEIFDSETHDLVEAPVNFSQGDITTIAITTTGSPTSSGQFHWGLAAIFEEVAPDTETVGIRRLRRSPHLSEELFWQFITSLQVDLEAGVGTGSGQGRDPQIMLRLSRDGGQTWGNELWTSVGALGDYETRAMWHRLGRARDLVIEVSMSDPVLWALFDAFIQGDGGTS